MQRLNTLTGHLAQAPELQSRLQAQVTSSHPSAEQKLSTVDNFPPNKSDFYKFDLFLSEEEKQARVTARAFATEKIAPEMVQYWEKAEFPKQWLQYLKDNASTFGGSFLKGYGCRGMSLMAACLTVMEMARVDASLATFYMVHCGLAMESIYLCGSEEQKQRYLPAMAKFDKIGCFALTEPDYGSDASSLRTTAKKVPGGWVINGVKRWIGNATFSDVLIVWARNMETNQVQGYIVNKDAKGMTMEKIQNKLPLRIVQNAHITFTDVFVPDNDFLALGTNFATGVGKALEISRVFVAWLPVAISMGAYDCALRYLQERKQFGAPLASYQIMQEKLVRMLGTIQSMYLLAERVTRMVERGEAKMSQITLAKAQNSLRGRECVALAREILGGNGNVTDYGVAKAFADMEAIYTYEGSYEVNSLVTGRDVTGIAAFKNAYKPKSSK